MMFAPNKTKRPNKLAEQRFVSASVAAAIAAVAIVSGGHVQSRENRDSLNLSLHSPPFVSIHSRKREKKRNTSLALLWAPIQFCSQTRRNRLISCPAIQFSYATSCIKACSKTAGCKADALPEAYSGCARLGLDCD